jgi:hypothetical protein
MRRKWLLITLSGVIIAVIASIVLWPAASTPGSRLTDGEAQPIGHGVVVTGDQVPTNVQVTEVSSVSQPFHMAVANGPMLQISPPGPLVKPVELTFKLERPPSDDEAILVASSESPNGPWTLLNPAVSADKTVATVQTDHFSLWQVLTTSISGLVKAFKKEVLDGLGGDLTTEAEKPQCVDEEQARQSGYQITSSSKDTVYWCFGIEEGKHVLKVVNRRRYPLTMDHPGLTLLSSGKFWPEISQLARLGSGDRTVLFPFDEVVMLADLPDGRSGGISTDFDRLAQTWYTLQVGVDTAAGILTRFGAGEGVISNGAVIKSRFDLIVKGMSDVLKVSGCSKAVRDLNVGTIFKECFDPKDIMTALGWKGLPFALISALGEVVEFFKSSFNAIGDQLNGRSEYQLKIVHTDARQVIAPFVGQWYVHGGSLTIWQDMSGQEALSIGSCRDGLGVMCNEVYSLAFSVSSRGVVTAKVTKVGYATWDGAKPPTGFRPSGPPYHVVGQVLTFQKTKADLITQIDGKGYKVPFCTPYGPSSTAGECGA